MSFALRFPIVCIRVRNLALRSSRLAALNRSLGIVLPLRLHEASVKELLVRISLLEVSILLAT